jgi:hypothetical protein
MAFSTASFPPVFLEKRLDLKSLKGQTKAEEQGTRQEKLVENGETEDRRRE